MRIGTASDAPSSSVTVIVKSCGTPSARAVWLIHGHQKTMPFVLDINASAFIGLLKCLQEG